MPLSSACVLISESLRHAGTSETLYAGVQDRVKRVENCVNVQAKVPTDPTVKSFGLSIKGQMMEVSSVSPMSLAAAA